jgi:hypothetical protein
MESAEGLARAVVQRVQHLVELAAAEMRLSRNLTLPEVRTMMRAAEILRALVLSAPAHGALFRSAVTSPPTHLADVRDDVAMQALGGTGRRR